MNANELSEILKGRTIQSVEEGSSKGWILLNFDLLSSEPKGGRVFVTVSVDAGDDPHYSQCALHFKAPGGGGYVYNVRDKR